MVNVPLDVEWENLDQAIEALGAELGDVARGLAVEAWNGILLRTPQYYGRMVVSYTFSINSPVFVDRSHAVEPVTERQIEEMPIQSRGRLEAVELANFYSAGADKAFKLGDTVYIANGVDHGEGGYSQAIEDGLVQLRAVNLPGYPVKRTIDSIVSRYGKNVSASRAQALRSLSIRG